MMGLSAAEALAFDMYGTLVDPIRIRKQLQRYLPDEVASHVSEVWRQKQIEFTFRLSVMERYEDFERVTRKALDYALAAAGRELDADHIDALMEKEGFGPYFRGYISVDEVRVYKPSPRVYRHVADRLNRPIGEIRLVSSNPFDDVGVEAAGMKAAWVDRSGGLFDTLGPHPEMIAGSLTELADRLEARRG